MLRISFDPERVPFSLDHTLSCGQVFRWEKRADSWYGIVEKKVVKLRQDEGSIAFESSSSVGAAFLNRYFRLEDDLPTIQQEIEKDVMISSALEKFSGLRLIRQDPWECLASYLCATNSNIKVIKQMIGNLCRRFGQKIEFEDEEFYAFPTPESLSKATVHGLEECKLGYRAPHLKHTAQEVASRSIDFEKLKQMRYVEARNALLERKQGKKTLLGIGPKAADCVLLFALEKTESFPLDVWMKRLVAKRYERVVGRHLAKRLLTKNSLRYKEYLTISESMRTYFGKFAGYAQEYLYYFARTNPPN